MFSEAGTLLRDSRLTVGQEPRIVAALVKEHADIDPFGLFSTGRVLVFAMSSWQQPCCRVSCSQAFGLNDRVHSGQIGGKNGQVFVDTLRIDIKEFFLML